MADAVKAGGADNDLDAVGGAVFQMLEGAFRAGEIDQASGTVQRSGQFGESDAMLSGSSEKALTLADLDLAWTTPGAEFEGAFKADGITERELQRAKNQFARDYILSRQSIKDKASQLGHAEVKHLRDMARESDRRAVALLAAAAS